MSTDKQTHPTDRLAVLRRQGLDELFPDSIRITVGCGTCGQAAGSAQVIEAISGLLCEKKADAEVVATGCCGMCWAEPLMTVHVPGKGRAIYGPVDERKAKRIVSAALSGKFAEGSKIGVSYREQFPLMGESTGIVIDSDDDIEKTAYFSIQERRLIGKCGHVEPCSVAQYAAYGGYLALEKALVEDNASAVVEQVVLSGLRGRGGAGFPTGKKWHIAASEAAEPKYVIANADEGDPGAFMDRMLMESDPHAVIEGMTLAGFAVGSAQGYIFTRSEYPLAYKTMAEAIDKARSYGLLGHDIMGLGFDFDIEVIRSAGAYVCGEETAMIRALEGFPGKPIKRPPYAAEAGLWSKPTVIDNVETFANIPLIIKRGPEWYGECGTEDSPGTKIFSIAGSTNRTGVIEVPMGISMKDVASALGTDDTRAKAYQIGGPSGVFLPANLDFTLDFESLSSIDGSIGSGGIVFLDDMTCIVDSAKYLTEFSEDESCGQCLSCRDGLRRCVELLNTITEGMADQATLDELDAEADRLVRGSLCGLGKMASRPIKSSLKFFMPEYEAHLEGRCPGRTCKELIGFSVIADKCPGCFCCKPTCPTNAMRGSFGKPFQIDERLCIRCWMCTATCPYDAVLAHECWEE